MSAMSPYAHAIQAVDALAPEDVPLVLQAMLARYPLEDLPLIFSGRPGDEIELLILWFTLGFTPMEHAEVIGMLMDKLIDRMDAPAAAKLLRLSAWVQACEEGNPQWPR